MSVKIIMIIIIIMHDTQYVAGTAVVEKVVQENTAIAATVTVPVVVVEEITL